MKLRLCFLIPFILAAPVFVFSQNDGKTTPYQNWTRDQIRKILSDSAWVKTVNHTQAAEETRIGVILPPTAQAKIMLRSALPVRQALLRQRQLDAKYDKMSDSEKKVFDEKNKALLECPACTNYYVVSVAYGNLSMENKYYLNDRKKSVYLSNDTGEKRELAEFVVMTQPESEIVFFFPRQNKNGEPLLTSKNKKLTFNFELKGLDGKSSFPFKKFDFEVSNFIEDGKIIF
jgi:hypothetical protein